MEPPRFLPSSDAMLYIVRSETREDVKPKEPSTPKPWINPFLDEAQPYESLVKKGDYK